MPNRWLRPLLMLVLLIAVALSIRLLERYAVTPSGSGNREGAAVQKQPVLVREFLIFGSYARLSFYGSPEPAAVAADRITAELQALHECINIFEPQSELSRLNAAAAVSAFKCSDRLWNILQASRRAYLDSDGIFDISVGPLLRLWGFHRKRLELPAAADIEAAVKLVGLDKIVFNEAEKSVSFTVPGMYLDLGGIAKGYALDLAVGIAVANGVDCGLLDLGGNVLSLPRPPPGRDAYTIGVRDPLAPDSIIGKVSLQGRAVSSSGGYERFVEIQGRRFGHIIDPRTGAPVTGVAGVTVLTPAGVNSDVFSTTVFVGGAAMAEKIVQEHPGTGILIVKERNGSIDLHEFGDWQFLLN